MEYTYKNGYREGVVFAFIKENTKILIEKRPVAGNQVEIFFPSGSIELKDYQDNSDYKHQALIREVSEEFAGRIEVKNCIYLQEIWVESVNIVFYIYLITDWQGAMPEFTIEEGRKHSLLQWIDLDERHLYFQFDSAFEICDRIERYLNISE